MRGLCINKHTPSSIFILERYNSQHCKKIDLKMSMLYVNDNNNRCI